MISSPLYRGWVVLGITVLLFVFWAGIGNSWGTTILCLQQDEDFPTSSLALLGAPLTVYYAFKLSLSSLIYLALAEFGLLDLRQVVAIGLSLMVLGLLLTSLANGPEFLVISFGVISGTGNGLVLLSMFKVIALWFPWSHRFHVLTTSALSNMMPLGTAILNNVNAQMCSIPSLGWRWAFRIYAVILSTLGLLLLLVYGNPPEEVSNGQCGYPTDKKLDFLEKPPWSRRSTIALHGVWAVAICCKGFAFFLPFVILPKHVTDLGYNDYEAAYVMTVLGIMGMIGQMFSSFVGDYLKGKLLVVSMVAAALLTLNNIIAAYSTSLTGAFVYSAGLTFGPYNAGYYAVINEIMDGENVDTLFLTMRFSTGVGATTGPYLAGYIRDVTGSYYAVFLSIASCFGVFVLATTTVTFINKWRDLRSVELMKNKITFE
ncbi:monocarboxylate transporter 13 isoform X2 [Lingula anatina]|uniref:Monocarboxylate transporter 13 isoform X2 n=1 Tax=Lingula anatina TaxID=7574 RepID=A0A1S3IFZ6_LINAN|nr:monocarboxylate transporter 13 isoform X2 [Lingula anatina]|eukprot:XP_013396394.2 monocarboxylate transporter 13 isoform X2 [Lingula anatina]